MKHIASKIISLICVVCMAFSCGISAFAAGGSPEILVTLDKDKKNAEIKLDNIGTSIYSVQITFNMDSAAGEYTLTPKNSQAYSTLRKEGASVILYIDSKDLIDGSKTINLASLKSDRAMNIASRAELICVDRSMDSKTDSVSVKVTQTLTDSQNPTDNNGNNGTTGTGGLIIPGGIGGVFEGVSGTQTSQIPSYSDVPADYWAAESIQYVTASGLFEGTSDTTFDPYIKMTRAMYVTVLSRFGTRIDSKWQIACDTPLKFADIPDGEWYSEAVGWAGGTGLVNGIGDNLFGPYESITREQIAVMTVNFANACGAQLPVNAEESEFSDANLISDWAVDAVKAAQQAGLIYGREDGSFAPQDTATRAEVAAILHRFAQTVR